MRNIAENVIRKCGGVAEVANICSRDKTRVRRWTYEKEKGGTGGLIPAECQIMLMEHARNKKLELSPDDFFPPDADICSAEDAA